MITIKGFAIVPEKIRVDGVDILSPVQEVYSLKEEAEKALRENRKCYLSPEGFSVKEVEVIIK